MLVFTAMMDHPPIPVSELLNHNNGLKAERNSKFLQEYEVISVSYILQTPSLYEATFAVRHHHFLNKFPSDRLSLIELQDPLSVITCHPNGLNAV